jgi:hypothetical protein
MKLDTDDLNPYRSPDSIEEPARDATPLEADSLPLDVADFDDPVTIASHAYPAEADLKCLLLDQHGIQALVIDAQVNFSLFLFNAVGGVKLVVARRDAERAVELLQEHTTVSGARAKVAHTRPPITFRCEECNAEMTFPDHRRGKVESCPSCREYVDVPE